LKLVDNQGQPVINSNKILLSINLYTADNPPSKITHSNQGSHQLIQVTTF
jgi:hypothetical protein